MFTIGCHDKDFRRATDVLKHSRSNPIDFDFYKQDDGFYIFEFPNSDYDDFKDITILLKNNGINAIGADTELTKAYDMSERKIMKLTDLLKEQQEPNRMESADDIIAALEKILETWETKEYESDEARWNEYYLDIEELVEDYKENQSIDRPDIDINEQKLRKLIQNLIKEWRR
jgi:hypothetical protein